MTYDPKPGDYVNVSFTGTVVSIDDTGTVLVKPDIPPGDHIEWHNYIHPDALTLTYRKDPPGTIRLCPESGNYAILTTMDTGMPWRVVRPTSVEAGPWAATSRVQDWPVIWTPDA